MTHEDVPGIVIEPGTRNTRLGVSGDVAPACVVPSAFLKTDDELDFEISVVGSIASNAEVYTPVTDGVITDFDGASKLWEYYVNKKLGMDFREQPLTITEELWNPAESKSKLLETVFEELQVPIFQLVQAPLAASFEAARPTSLVVSAGAGVVSAVPVIDGVVRAKASTHTRFAGDFANVHILQQLAHAKDNIVPFYRVKQKSQQPADLLPKGSTSFDNYQLSRLIDDFKRVCCQVSPVPLRGPDFKGTKAYEFPNGFQLLVGHERTVSVEPLFQPTMNPLPDNTHPELNSLGLSEVVYQTLQKVDAPLEVVDNLFSNIVFHGGSSRLPGVAQRLHVDLQNMMPNMMPNIIIPNTHPVWVGASILASLGEFDEGMWITRQDYLEGKHLR